MPECGNIGSGLVVWGMSRFNPARRTSFDGLGAHTVVQDSTHLMNVEGAPKPETPDAGGEPRPEDPARELSRRDFLNIAVGGLAAGAAFQIGGRRAEAAADAESPEYQTANVERMRDIVARERVRENIQFAKDRFGDAEGMVSNAAMNLLDLDSFTAAERARKPPDTIAAHQRFVSRQYEKLWDIPRIEERIRKREAEEGLSAAVEGFGAIRGFSDAHMQNLLASRFHRRWLYGNVSAIRYIDREEHAPHYQVAGRAEGRGMGSMFLKHERQTIELFRTRDQRPAELLRATAHELGHHQDWTTANRLGLHERLQFLRDVGERLEAPDRYLTHYVETAVPREFQEKRGDPRDMRHRQAREYWATVMERYSLDPEEFRRSHPKDHAVAERWYRRLVPPPGEPGR